MHTWLNNLAYSFQTRFKQTGDVSDLTEAISIQQRAVKLIPEDHPRIPGYLNNLGMSFSYRFGRIGDVSDLTEAIQIHQRAVNLTHDGNPEMQINLNNLGTSFKERFQRTGDIRDLSEAISISHRVVQLTPEGHPLMPMWLNNLGTSFLYRFEHTHDVSDLEEAISFHQQAVQLTPSGHINMPMRLDALRGSLERRFLWKGDLSDLKEAISIQQRAVQLTPDGHNDMPGLLNSLGNIFLIRFGRTDDVSDLSEAISNHQRAVQLTPGGHPEMPSYLNSLGVSFHVRFRRTNDVSDLSEAISNQQRAVQLTPNGHPDMPGWLNNLGTSFRSRFECTGDFSDIQTATSTYQKSATSIGDPSNRLRAAQQWAQLSMTHNPPHSLTAYGVAIDLVSEIAGMDRTIEQRHAHLIGISTLTTSAASAAFTLCNVEKALEWLEQGCCLVWSQLNQLRSPLDHLRAHDEHLAKRFSNISGALEASGTRRGSGGFGQDASFAQKISLQDEAHLHIKLSREWSQLLDEIRDIPQFHNFLRPPQTSDLLRRLPLDGVVVLVNIDGTQCNALALIPSCEAPIHIPLVDFTHEEASDLKEHLRLFLSSYGVRMREVDRAVRPAPRPNAKKESGIYIVLEALWLRVVRPILDGLAFSVGVSHFTKYLFIDIFPSLLPRQIQPEYGGVQRDLLHFFHSMPREFMVELGDLLQASAFPNLQSPRIPQP